MLNLFLTADVRSYYLLVDEFVVKIIVHLSAHPLGIMAIEADVAASESCPPLRHLLKRDIDCNFTILREDLGENVVVLDIRVIIHDHGQEVITPRGILVQVNIWNVRAHCLGISWSWLGRDRSISEQAT